MSATLDGMNTAQLKDLIARAEATIKAQEAQSKIKITDSSLSFDLTNGSLTNEYGTYYEDVTQVFKNKRYNQADLRLISHIIAEVAKYKKSFTNTFSKEAQ